MATPEQLKEIGKSTRFTSDNQPEGKRKKNRFKHLRDEFELNKRDVETILEYVLSLTIEELKALIQNKEKTAIEQAFASAILKSISKGDLSQIDKMLDRKIGRVPNTVVMDGNIELTKNSSEIRKEIEEKLIK